MTAQLIPSISIEALLARRYAVLAEVETIVGALARIDALTRCPDSGLPGSEGNYLPGVRCYMEDRRPFDVAVVRKRIDRALWDHLLHRSGLWSFMDARARDEWNTASEKGQFPELTHDNIASAIEDLHRKRGGMVARGVADLFRRLSRHHVTNKAAGFSRKIIMGYLCSVYVHGLLTVNHEATDALDDLDRVLHLLRGEPAPEHQCRNAFGLVNNAVGKGTMIAEFRFFQVRAFKAGTGHIIFHDEADVDRLNAVLSVESNGVALCAGGPRGERIR